MTEAANHVIRQHLREHIKVTEALLEDEFVTLIGRLAETITSAYRGGHKVILFGNGGSAADAQHLAAEFVGRYRCERRPLPALALTVNTSAVTAIANDYEFEIVFARQLEALGAAGDVAIGISTSGRSANVIAALRAARRAGLTTVALTGRRGSPIEEVADFCVCIPAEHTAGIQEAHITVGHMLCELVERALFGEHVPVHP
jgi:D-sedoheptulose 7-phosphate isomerase